MTQPNDQTKILERDIANLSKKVDSQCERFDRHLEIYAQNGKELAALKTEVKNNHERLTSAIVTLTKAIEKQDSNHVTAKEFWPVKTLIYSLTGIILISVITAIVGLVVFPQDQLTASEISDAVEQGFNASIE